MLHSACIWCVFLHNLIQNTWNTFKYSRQTLQTVDKLAERTLVLPQPQHLAEDIIHPAPEEMSESFIIPVCVVVEVWVGLRRAWIKGLKGNTMEDQVVVVRPVEMGTTQLEHRPGHSTYPWHGALKICEWPPWSWPLHEEQGKHMADRNHDCEKSNKNKK